MDILTPPFILNPVAQIIWEEIAPLAYDDPNNGWATAHWINAWTAPLVLLSEIARDDGDNPGWSSVLDYERAADEALDFLGQFIGVVPQVGESADLKRARIALGAGLKRGTPQAMADEIKLYLSGTKTVFLTERASSAWNFIVSVYFDEAPETDRPITNLIQNPTGRTAATDWSTQIGGGASGVATLTPTNDASFSGGSGGMLFDITTPTTTTGILYTSYSADGTARLNMRPVVPGEWYAVRGKYKITQQFINAAVPLGLFLRLNTAAGAFLSETQVALSAAQLQTLTVGTVVELSGVIQIPAGTGAFAGLALRSSGVAAIGVDGALITGDFLMAKVASASSVVPAYGDGSRPGWTWAGTADASNSIRTATTIIQAAILRQKPAGLILSALNFIAGGDFNTLLASSTNFDDVTTTHASFDSVRTNPAL